MLKDYYAILGVNSNAENVVIKAACFAMSQRYHPDKYSGDPSESHAKMADINEARKVLCDPVKRAEYDKQRIEIVPISTIEKKDEVQLENNPSNKLLRLIPRKKSDFIIYPLGIGIGLWLAEPTYFNKLFSEYFQKLIGIFQSLAIISIIIFILFVFLLPKRDRRFKTGYKNNAKATIPRWVWNLLKWSIILNIATYGISLLFHIPWK